MKDFPINEFQNGQVFEFIEKFSTEETPEGKHVVLLYAFYWGGGAFNEMKNDSISD